MAHTFGGQLLARTSSTGNPITTASVAVDELDTVLGLWLKVNGGTNRAGGAPSINGVSFTQADTTQKAATSPEASCELWYLLNPCNPFANPNAFLAGNYAITIPNTGALTVFYTVASGRAAAGGSSRLDAAIGTNGTSTNPRPGSITRTEEGEIGFAVSCNGATDYDPATPDGTGFGTGTGTPLGTFDDGAHGGAQEYHLPGAIGATNLGWTFGTSDDWGAVAAYFKEVPPQILNKMLSPKCSTGNTGIVSVTERAGFR